MSSTTVPQAANEITGGVLFYQSPEPLNSEAHAGLGVELSDTPFTFAAQGTAVPLQVGEFGPASLSYPVIFSGPDYFPLAIMGIRRDENLFVTPEGGFEPEAYIPAFVRRYPFVLANDDVQQRLVVCIDRAAPFLKAGGAIPLFENGQPSEYTKNAIQFCQDFEIDRQRTENFVKRLRELDLFETKQALFTPRNPDGSAAEPVQLAEYFAVSPDKLNALPQETLMELLKSGALQQIYIHLNSLLSWDRLIARALLRQPAPAAGNA